MLKNIRNKIIIYIMGTRLYRWIVLKKIPFIRFTTRNCSIRGNTYHDGYFNLQPGMIIGTIDTNKASGILIPKVTGGVLSHAALCVSKRDPEVPDLKYPEINPIKGQGEGLEVIEMTHLDFTFSDFFDICHESERVIIFDCKDWDDLYRRRVIQAGLLQRTSKYDPDFSLFDVDFLYCSELIVKADVIAGNGTPRLQCDYSDLMGIGRPYISPDGLLCSKNIVVIWDSKGELTGLTGPEIEKIIFKKESKTWLSQT